MIVRIEESKAKGRVTAPPSKSMAHRAIICASLAKGTSLIENISMSKDIEATIRAMSALGAKINVHGSTAMIEGGLCPEEAVIDCGESGSTLRFLIPICLTLDTKVTLTGTKRLFERSLSVYETLCDERGFLFEKREDRVTVKGKLTSGTYSVRGDISSQFITGLMFALSLADGNSRIKIEGKLESAPYLDLTEQTIQSFGAVVSRTGNFVYIEGGAKYQPQKYRVEADCSNAAFLEAFNLVSGDGVDVLGIDPDTKQGDSVYFDCFGRIWAGVPTIDISDCPDLGPVLMAAGALCDGVTLVGTHRLKIKESDRGNAMASELKKFGVRAVVEEDKITVSGGIKKPTEPLFGHNDHRIVMSLAVMCSSCGGVIEGAEAVSKSYPDFFEVIQRLGVEVHYETD